jgi:hypothetical protein
MEAPPGKATRRGRREDALGSASHERVESQGCPHCGPRGRRLGPLAWAFAVSLQELRAHIQRADQHPDGASAENGSSGISETPSSGNWSAHTMPSLTLRPIVTDGATTMCSESMTESFSIFI